MVCLQFTDRLSMGEKEMECDLSSLHLLADAASLVSERQLCLTPSIFDRDDGKKVTVVTATTFGPMGVGWIVRKKRSPRARGLTFHAQKLSSHPVGVVVQKNKQENLRGVPENCKKRPRAFDSTETQEWNRVSKKPKKSQKKDMELDFSSLHLLADAASLISEGKLSLAPSIVNLDDGKKVTVVTTTTFGPIGVGWIVRKKRSPHARGLTFHAQKSSSDPVFVVVQKNKQETWRGVTENCKKQSRPFDPNKTQESDRVSKKTEKTRLMAPISPSEMPINSMDKILEMLGRDVTLVVEKTLTATDMSRGQCRLSIPKSQIRQKFLSEEEIHILDRKEGIQVSLIEPCLEVSHGLKLKKWNYSSKSFSYVLTERWNAVAHPYEQNELIENVRIQLWSFRVDGILCFCLTKVEAPVRASGKYGSYRHSIS